MQDVPLALLIVKASTIDVVVAATRAPPPPLVVLVQEATPTTEVDAPAALASPIVSPSFTVATSLLSVGVVTMSAPVMSPSLSSTPLVPPPTVLASTLTSTSYHPYVCLDHVYTSNDVDSL